MKLTGYTKREARMLAIALGVALESRCNQRVGAVVVKGGAVLSRASNRDYNHPRVLPPEQRRAHASICAERRALARISEDRAQGATIFVARAARRDGSYACSKPCDRCETVMKRLGVKRCVYIP